jgi:hypothetical protein
MRPEEPDDPRRRILIQALTTGLLSLATPAQRAMAAPLLGSRPGTLPEGKSIYRLSGEVSVNGSAATPDTRIYAGDRLRTGPDGEIVFVVGGNAMILRASSRLQLESPSKEPASLVISVIRLVTGAVLSVSRNRAMKFFTPTSTVGIRGTGFYAEADPEQTYFCTCYGVVDVEASTDPASRTRVSATQHDRPLYIVKDGGRGKNIREAPFINHTDQELMLIEALVGRIPPFVFPRSDYLGPRREY